MKNLSKKDLNWIVRRILLVIYDICAVNASFFSAILVRFYFNDTFSWLAETLYIPAWIKFTPWYTLACIIIFLIFGLYRSRLRSAGYYDLSRIVLANLVDADYPQPLLSSYSGYVFLMEEKKAPWHQYDDRWEWRDSTCSPLPD